MELVQAATPCHPTATPGAQAATPCLQRAVLRIQVQLHSFLLDLDWVLEACPALGSVPKVVVLHGDGRCLSAACLSDPRHAGRFVVLEPPTVKGKGVHHSKLVLVRSAAEVALHVTTANFTYTSFAAKTNATWSACFPRRTEAPSPPAAESLGSDLQQYLEAVKELGESPPPSFGVHRLARSADGRSQLLFEASSPADATRWREFQTAWVREYDFSGTEARLVATVPPRNEKKGHAGAELRLWGQARLRRLLETVDDSAWHGSDLVVQFSSVGLSQNQDGWLRQMAAAFCPNDAQLPPISIVFPTTREVRDSLEGWVAGHSIPCHDAKAISSVLAKVQQQERERGRPAYTATPCAWDAAHEVVHALRVRRWQRQRRRPAAALGGGGQPQFQQGCVGRALGRWQHTPRLQGLRAVRARGGTGRRRAALRLSTHRAAAPRAPARRCRTAPISAADAVRAERYLLALFE